MRNAIPTLLAGGILLTAAACGTAGPGSPSTASVPPADPALATTCEALSQAYEKNMAPFAQALTGLVADPKAKAPAQQALADFATAVQDATKTSEDAELRAAGEKAAGQMRAKSSDTKFFATIKTPADVDKTMGTTLTGRLSPVQKQCS